MRYFVSPFESLLKSLQLDKNEFRKKSFLTAMKNILKATKKNLKK